MDPFSALRNEVFRPLAAVVMPGVLAIAPFVVVVCNGVPDVRDFYDAQPTWFLFGVIAIGTIAGMLLEDIGTSIERGIDRCMDLEYLYGHDKVWLAYLACGTEDNNGRRFLGWTVTRMKFINSLMPALFFFALGITSIHFQVGKWSLSSLIYLWLGIFGGCTWLFRTSAELSEVASVTRYCLLDDKDKPSEYDVEAMTVRRHRHFAYALGELFTSRASDIDLRGRSAISIVPIAFALFFGLTKTKSTPASDESAQGHKAA